MHNDVNLLLHYDLSQASPSPNSSTRSCSSRTSERRRNSTEYSTIQYILWIQITLVVCYLPSFIIYLLALTGLLGNFIDLAWGVVISLVILNSSLNPFLYCWKMREVRQAVKKHDQTVMVFLMFSASITP